MFSYKMNKFQGSNVQNIEYSYEYCVVYWKIAMRVEHNHSHCNKSNKMVIIEVKDVLMNLFSSAFCDIYM